MFNFKSIKTHIATISGACLLTSALTILFVAYISSVSLRSDLKETLEEYVTTLLQDSLKQKLTAESSVITQTVSDSIRVAKDTALFQEYVLKQNLQDAVDRERISQYLSTSLAK